MRSEEVDILRWDQRLISPGVWFVVRAADPQINCWPDDWLEIKKACVVFEQTIY